MNRAIDGLSTHLRIPKCCGTFFFEYETPKVVSIQNVPLGILRVVLQLLVIAFVVVFQLWYSQGYQGWMTTVHEREDHWIIYLL